MTYPVVPFRGTAFRIVESQEQVATAHVVSNLADQSRLEELLEDSKPKSDGNGVLHFLLTTPFRYPPLAHGSRFGTTFEPSLFYGSLERNTCLAECAYYRLMFYLDMKTSPPNPVTTQHTLFQVLVKSEDTVDLRVKSYDQEKLTNACSYSFTQSLGTELREQGVDVLLFQSARDPELGSNIALYRSTALGEKRPRYQEMWQSQVDGVRVIFRGQGGIVHFPGRIFCDKQGKLLRVTG